MINHTLMEEVPCSATAQRPAPPSALDVLTAHNGVQPAQQRSSAMTTSRVFGTTTALATAVLLAVAGCTSATDDAGQQSGQAAAKLAGSTDFNDAKLAELAARIKEAVQGKDTHAVRVAMVINSP